MMKTTELIAIESRNQTSVGYCQYCTVGDDLHAWANRFILESKLQTTAPALMIADLRGGIYGLAPSSPSVEDG